MNIIISNTSKVPIYEQIKEQIKEQIINNQILENEQLPSIRQLAKDLKISVITTTRAYNELENEGFVTSVAGKGFYVMPTNKDLIKEQAYKSIEEHYLEILRLSNLAQIDKKELQNIFEIIERESTNE
ncbi:MAG: GntR family transcriptional regulator [Erysipelotrichaceae bacterium]|jgi:GntR family transcriptional regulator|nr:GntR family transcriptional regulator [Erysipelotrichaceae bacterium]